MNKKIFIPIVLVLSLLISINIGCKKEEEEDENKAPETPTSPTPANNATDIDASVTTISWTCTDPESDALTYDVYFGTTESPELKESNHSGTSYDVETLDIGTKYYWKIVAKDGNDHETQGEVWNFTTSTIVTCTDYDGNTYETVVIGDQIWMAEDLKSLHYTDGTAISSAAACNGDASLVTIFGRLYTWNDAINGETETNTNPSGVQGICPNGWHLPSNAEFQELIAHLGGSEVAGGKLKSTSTSHWASPNVGATNESGFNGVASGLWGQADGFWYYSYGVAYWSSTLEDAVNAYSIALDYSSAASFNPASGTYINKHNIRCIKN